MMNCERSRNSLSTPASRAVFASSSAASTSSRRQNGLSLRLQRIEVHAAQPRELLPQIIDLRLRIVECQIRQARSASEGGRASLAGASGLSGVLIFLFEFDLTILAQPLYESVAAVAEV